MYSAAYSKTKTMETKEERFFAVQKHFDLTDQAFADRLEIKRDNIQKIKKGQKIGPKTLAGLYKGFPEINKDWFELGRGEMLNKVVQIAEEPVEPYQKSHEEPMLSMKASTAFTKYYEQVELIRKLLDSKQDEFIEIYTFINKLK